MTSVRRMLPGIVALALVLAPACTSSGETRCDELFATLEAQRDLERTLVLRAQESDTPGGSEITAEEQAELDPLDAQTTADYNAWVAAGCNTSP